MAKFHDCMKSTLDDTIVFNILQTQLNVLVLLVAHELDFFSYLAKNTRCMDQISFHFKLTPRAVQALISILSALKLITKK